MEVAPWCDHQLVWCATVECTELWLAFTVVNRWGEQEVMRKQEIFSLLVHLLWRIKMEVQENATVCWCPKSTTAHPYEWEVRVRVYVREGAWDVVMEPHGGRTVRCARAVRKVGCFSQPLANGSQGPEFCTLQPLLVH